MSRDLEIMDMTLSLGSRNIIPFVIGVILFGYIVYRATTLSITHDEAYTYTRYVSSSYWQIITYETGNILPNNHVVNTLCQKLFSSILGVSELSLRLGNVLLAGVFLLGSFCIGRLMGNIPMLISFVILTMHPYLLDFMSLSRGYGMSVSLTIASLYYFIKSIRNNYCIKYGIFGMTAAALSVWANFSWLNYFCVVTSIYVLQYALLHKFSDSKEKRKEIFKVIALTAAHYMVLAALIIKPLHEIIKRKLLFGGETGFWTDTVDSLVDRLSYGAPYYGGWQVFMYPLISLVVVASGVLCVRVLLRKSKEQEILLLFCTLLGLSLLTIVQRDFMGSYYPMERTALPFVPVFLVLCLLLINIASTIWGNSTTVFAWTIGVVFLTHFGFSMNLHYVLDWKYDANTKQIVSDINTIESDHFKLGVHPLFEPAVNFYRKTMTITKFDAIHADGYRQGGEYEFYIIPAEDKEKLVQERLEVIKTYQPGEATLAEKSSRSLE
jgi:hypothetical protein